MDSFDQLFDEFSSGSYEQWKEKVIKDLKGKELSDLRWLDEDGIEHQPYYTQEDLDFELPSIQKQREPWTISQTYHLNDWKITELKAELEYAFRNGLEKAIVKVDAEADLSELNDFDQLLFHFNDLKLSKNGKALLDPYSGRLKGSNDPLAKAEELKNFLDTSSNILVIDGFNYASRGASAVQEIAHQLWQCTDYLDLLGQAAYDLSSIHDQLLFKSAIGPSFFLQIAKLRALRLNVEKLFRYFDLQAKARIWAESNPLYLDDESFNNNLIRSSTQALSAVLGNADWLSLSLQAADDNKLRFAARMSRNVQLLLKHESHLDKVDDMVRGAYYLESLTHELAQRSWQKFTELESKGSLAANMQHVDFWKEIDDVAQNRLEEYRSAKRPMIGVNKYKTEPEGSRRKIDHQPNAISKRIKEEER